MRLNAKQIAQCTGGEFLVNPIDAAAIISQIEWDSRNVTEGCLYVALPGNKVDGHTFVDDAIKAGAMAVLVTEPVSAKTEVLAREMGAAIIQVSNTAHAVLDIAKEWRNHLKGHVCAVTGSTGKTTTKNLIRDVVSAKYSVVATKGNQNNELGAPKTLLAADPDTEVIVLEMGMDGPGQITSLCDMAKPSWGVITNVGDSHIERLGSKEGIAKAKAELLRALPEGTGKAFLNAADEFTPFMIEHSNLEVRGIQTDAFNGQPEWAKRSVWAEDISIDGEGRPEFTLCARGFKQLEEDSPTLFDMEPDVERAQCHLGLRGSHNVSNACAACAVGLSLGIPLQDIVSALEGSVAEAGRQEILTSRDGFKIINDAYNASPDSMKASLAMLASMNVTGARCAVLGDMGELGDYAIACHEGVGKAVAESSIDRLVCVGELSRNIARAAIDSGMDEGKVECVDSIGQALEALEGTFDSGDVVLVKASRFMELNRIAEGLAS